MDRHLPIITRIDIKRGVHLKKRILIAVLAVGILLGTYGCTAQNKNEIRIGMNVELSGRLSQYGHACLEGAQLYFEELNAKGGIAGRPVRLIVLDNRSENSDAAIAAIRLASKEKVAAILGPATSGGVKASLATNPSVPIITPSATADDLSGKNASAMLFRICFTDTAQGKAMGEYAHRLGYKQVALLTDVSSDYSRGLERAFANTFEALGGRVTAVESYTAADTDFFSVLTKLKAKPFDALYIPGYYSEAGLIIRQARELGIHTPILGGDAFDSPALFDLCGDVKNLNSVYYTNHFTVGSVQQQAFSTAYQKKFTKDPSAFAALSYDAARVVGEALQNGGLESTAALIRSMENIRDFSGVTGTFYIDAQHNAHKPVLLTQIKDGKFLPALDGNDNS